MDGQAQTAGLEPDQDLAGIPFDSASGIPVEEQRQILADINALAKPEPLAAPPRFTAKKRGFRFPLLVNLGAVLLLGAGSGPSTARRTRLSGKAPRPWALRNGS